MKSSFAFDLPTRIEFGVNAQEHLPKVTSRLGFNYPMIVTDNGVRRAGLIDDLLSCMDDLHIPHEIFEDIEPNPKDYNVDRGVARILECGCDSIITVGGGSPMDCAKAMAAVATLGGSTHDYVNKGRINQKVLPIIAIPTTAGTGSEVTFGAVITHSERKFKFTIKGNTLAPKMALLDPNLTVTMPPPLTAATGMDALTHAIEAYTAKKDHPISNSFALASIDLIWHNLKSAFTQGTNIEARAGMLLGSLMAGIAFSQSDVGAVHCIAEALGGMYDIPHGVCNAVMLPTIMEYNLQYCRESYAQIATVMGIEWRNSEIGAHKAVEAVKKMAQDVELPNFSSFGINPGDFGEIAINSAENGSNASNARPMSSRDYEDILNKLYISW